MKALKALLRLVIGTIVLILSIIGVSDFMVEWHTMPYLYDSPNTIPKRKVGLLLGTSPKSLDGNVNLYYKYRLEAAVDLFNHQKIDFILVSGDNSTQYYDEPTTIKKDLIAMGVPESKIVLDYAGFRTLDSIVRADKVFGEEIFTIISQPFHNKRALYLAHRKGINAIAFNAREVGVRYGWKVFLRERLARVKMMMDILFNKQPKFLGEKVPIGR